MSTGLEFAASRTCGHDGQGAVLMGCSVTQSGSVSKESVVKKGLSIGLLDPIHLLEKVSELLHVKIIHLAQVLDELLLVVGHLVMTAWLVEKTLEQVGSIPTLGPDHEGGDVGQPALQGNDHEIPHQANVLSAGKLSVHRNAEIDLAQFVLQSLQSRELTLDGAYGVEVLGKLVLILPTQLAP